MSPDYDGLVVAFPVDRPLSQEERLHELQPNVRIDVTPDDGRSVIARRRATLDLIDKVYRWRGLLTLVCLPLAVLFTVAVVLALSDAANAWPAATEGSRGGIAFLVAVAVFLCLPMVGLLSWLLSRELFFRTHFAVRFDRVNRQVHVQRTERGTTVLKVGWDEVHWHVRRNRHRQFGSDRWFIAGHVMDERRKTVKETFSFGYVGDSPEACYPQWEYVRRFMQDGADAVPPASVHLPVCGRREGFWWGARTALFAAPGHPALTILLLPVLAPMSIVRWLVMQTCSVPVWPASAQTGGDEVLPAADLASPNDATTALALALGLAMAGAMTAAFVTCLRIRLGM